jgi:hypothetical protein
MMMNHAKEEGQECETFPSFSSSTSSSVGKFHFKKKNRNSNFTPNESSRIK